MTGGIPECYCAASKYMVYAGQGEWVTLHAAGQITRNNRYCPRCGEELRADGTHTPRQEPQT